MTQPCSFFDPPSEPGRVKAKICGFTDAAEAEKAIALGADALGINFWPKSKRFISLADALPWLTDLSDTVTRIGVFVNPSDDEVAATLDSGAIDAAQLHGNESLEQLTGLLNRGYHVFKAMGVKDSAMLDTAEAFPGDTLLLDAYAPVEYGGTGETMDWALGREAVTRWPDRKIVLAGGLKPENIADAIRQVRPFGVDVASGVESGTPGRKDLGKVAAFLDAVREIG